MPELQAAGVADTIQSTDALVKWLDQKHPFHKAKAKTWMQISLLYEAGSTLAANADQLLMPRPKEPNEVLQARIERVTDFDSMSTGIDWYAGKMFRDETRITLRTEDGTEVKDPDPFWADFTKNANNAGKSLAEVMKEAFLDALKFRDGWLLIDKPNTSGVESEAERKAQGGNKPYLVRYEPSQVYNWQEDEFGNLLWVVFATTTCEQEFLSAPKYVDRWYYFDQAEYRVYEASRKAEGDKYDDKSVAKLTTSGPHALAKFNRVPVRRLSVPDGYWFGNKTLLASKAHLNAVNALDWGLMMGCFAMPVFFTDRDIAAIFSEASHMILGPNDKVEWLEHPGQSFSTMMDYIRQCREEIYRKMYLVSQGRDSSAAPAVQSGYSKELDMASSDDVLQALGSKHLGPFEQNVLLDIADARAENLKPDVQGYTFTAEVTPEEVDVAQGILDMGIPSDTLTKEMQKKVAMRALQNANADIKTKVIAEIDAAPKQSDELARKAKVMQDLMAASYDTKLNQPPEVA